MESVSDLLGRYGRQEPDESIALKQYIAAEFQSTASIGVQGELLIITVGSASLANALRLRLPALQKAAQTKKRIIFRIG